MVKKEVAQHELEAIEQGLADVGAKVSSAERRMDKERFYRSRTNTVLRFFFVALLIWGVVSLLLLLSVRHLANAGVSAANAAKKAADSAAAFSRQGVSNQQEILDLTNRLIALQAEIDDCVKPTGACYKSGRAATANAIVQLEESQRITAQELLTAIRTHQSTLPNTTSTSATTTTVPHSPPVTSGPSTTTTTMCLLPGSKKKCLLG